MKSSNGEEQGGIRILLCGEGKGNQNHITGMGSMNRSLTMGKNTGESISFCEGGGGGWVGGRGNRNFTGGGGEGKG